METSKTRVLFLSHHLGAGGAERVFSILLEHLDRTRFEPGLVLCENKREYRVPDDVPIFGLCKRAWFDYPKLVWRLSRIFINWKPDVVLSISRYTSGISALSQQLSRSRTSLVSCEHSIPSFYFSQHRDLGTLLFDKWMPRWVYKYADKVVCVSQRSADDTHKIFNVACEKIAIVYNPLDIQNILSLSEENVEHPWFKENDPIIISIGSLIDIKGYPFLLRAFAQVVKKYPCRLIILGKGYQEKALKDLAKELGVEKSVAFLGFQTNPFKFSARSTVFVLPSLTEAFPMVVLEAMACGIPVVSTASPGSSEIITNGVDGLLVPLADEDALGKAILKLIIDRKLAMSLARTAESRVNEYSIQNTIPKYEELLTKRQVTDGN